MNPVRNSKKQKEKNSNPFISNGVKKSFYLLIFFPLLFAVFVFAQKDLPPEVTLPIAELGNCETKIECEAYCDSPENMEVCLNFAEKYNLIPQEEIEMARKMLALGVTSGPGGCQGQEECEAYCDDINNIEECFAFGERYGLIPPDELEEGRKVVAAIRQGIKPPNCRNKTDCDVYCSQPDHFEECLTFATAAGLIPPDEIEEAQMVLQAIQKGASPPNCQGDEECDVYCSQPEHLEECLTFAEAAGFISPEEAEMARKTGGRGPGDCRSEEECEAYCEDPANMEECLEFAVMIGEMTAEEAAKILKGGPGGCRSEEECGAYCENPANLEECVNFWVEEGELTPEEGERMLRGGPGGCRTEEECQAYCEDPAHLEECMWAAVESGEMTAEEVQQILNEMRMRKEMERQMQEQMQQEMMPEESPQSLFEQWKKFLASLISAFGL